MKQTRIFRQDNSRLAGRPASDAQKVTIRQRFIQQSLDSNFLIVQPAFNLGIAVPADRVGTRVRTALHTLGWNDLIDTTGVCLDRRSERRKRNKPIARFPDKRGSQVDPDFTVKLTQS